MLRRAFSASAALRVFLAVGDEDEVAARVALTLEPDRLEGAAVLGEVEIAALHAPVKGPRGRALSGGGAAAPGGIALRARGDAGAPVREELHALAARGAAHPVVGEAALGAREEDLADLAGALRGSGSDLEREQEGKDEEGHGRLTFY
jgi:hypothetical protein